MNRDQLFWAKVLGGVILLAVIFYFIGYPMLNVWKSGLQGEAELKRAEWNRQIAVREAEAKEQSAKALANAEIIRAKGVAEANRIIGDSLHNNEAYLRYLWIHNMEQTKNQIIYIPTEAGLPILEAARRGNK